MTDLAKLVVALEAETAKYQKELKRTNAQLKRYAKQQKAQLNIISRGFDRLGVAAAAFFSVDLIRRAGQMTDQFNQLSVRIRTATRETGDFVTVQKSLADIAIRTGASFETTIDTFQALSRIRKDLGATNGQFLTLTKLVNQLGVIGGASTTAISNGLRQFNQGLAAGVFRAEEFNSIVENLPELAKALADGMGKTQGELRKLVIEGKLASREVFEVLLKQSAEINDRFLDIPTNLDRAFNALGTAVGGALSRLDKAVGGTAALAGAIQRVADELAIISGNATETAILEERIRDLQDQMALLSQSSNRFLNSSNPLWQDWADQMNTLNLRILNLREQLKKLNEENAETEKTVREWAQTVARGALAAPIQGPDLTFTGVGAVAAPVQGPTLGELRGNRINPIGEMTTREDAAEFDKLIFGRFDVMEERMQNFNALFTENMVQAANSGFDSVLQSWVRTLQQMAAKALASQVFKLLGFGNADGGFLGIGKLFGGERAHGGPVSSGRAYLVGENGPEMFVPPSAGRIEPNAAGGNVFHIDARGAAPGTEVRIREAVAEAVAKADSNRVESRRRSR